MKLVKIFVLIFLSSCAQNTSENSKLSQIPKEDRLRIEKLFSRLIWDETFAYVLFGNKPMSVCDQDKMHSSDCETDVDSTYDLESLWRTWGKYAYLFPMSEFVFLTEGNSNYFEVCLLNRSNCLEVIKKNLTLFQTKTGKNLNACEMFDYIVANANGDMYKKSLNKSQGLYGILLGFGTENSLGFENYFSVKREPLPPETGQHIDTEDPISPMIPCFASFSEDETLKLRENYQKQREAILKIYSKRNFLETTINRLTGHNSEGKLTDSVN